jgi:hypothetical protein
MLFAFYINYHEEIFDGHIGGRSNASGTRVKSSFKALAGSG